MSLSQKLKELFKKKNVEVTDDEVNTILADDTKPPKDEPKDLTQLQRENSVLAEQVKTLTSLISSEKEEREKVLKSETERLKTEQTNKVNAAVTKLFADKKITEAQKEHWKSLFEASFESTSKVAEALPPLETPKGTQSGTGTQTPVKTDSPIMQKILERNSITPEN